MDEVYITYVAMMTKDHGMYIFGGYLCLDSLV